MEQSGKMEVTFYSDLDGVPVELMVSDIRNVDVQDWSEMVLACSARIIIPPFDIHSPAWTSRAAERALAMLPKKRIGVVVSGTDTNERLEFFIWAQEAGYAPIVILPHRDKNRQQQLMPLMSLKLIMDTTWIHFADGGDPLFNQADFPGHYTYSDIFFKEE